LIDESEGSYEAQKNMSSLRLSWFALFSLFFVLILAGCASPNSSFQTKADPTFHGSLGRVVIVYANMDTTTTLGRNFSEKFAKALADLLIGRSVPSAPLELDLEKLDRQARLREAVGYFHASQILVFRPANYREQWVGTPGALRRVTTLELEISIDDLQRNKTIWRSVATCSTAPLPEDFAKEVVEQLSQAKLLKSGPPGAKPESQPLPES
jgi:hypothetical protein